MLILSFVTLNICWNQFNYMICWLFLMLFLIIFVISLDFVILHVLVMRITEQRKFPHNINTAFHCNICNIIVPDTSTETKWYLKKDLLLIELSNLLIPIMPFKTCSILYIQISAYQARASNFFVFIYAMSSKI